MDCWYGAGLLDAPCLTHVSRLQYRPLIFNDNGRPETIQINRAQPHPSNVLQSAVNGHRGGRGIVHPGMMQTPYQLMPMMPNQMAPNYDAPETDGFTPQQTGSAEEREDSDTQQDSPGAEMAVTASCQEQDEKEA